MRTLRAGSCFALVAAASCAMPTTPPAPPAAAIPRASVGILASDLRWGPMAPGLPHQIANLWGDRTAGPYGELVKVPAGWESARHAHTGDLHVVVISGTMIHIDEKGDGADRKLDAGSYIMQRGGGMHVDKCLASVDCLELVHQEQKADIILP